MKTKYVCRGLISLYVHNNRTMWSTNLQVKICRRGEKEKEPKKQINTLLLLIKRRSEQTTAEPKTEEKARRKCRHNIVGVI